MAVVQSYWWYFAMHVVENGMELAMANFEPDNLAIAGHTYLKSRFEPANDPLWEQPA